LASSLQLLNSVPRRYKLQYLERIVFDLVEPRELKLDLEWERGLEEEEYSTFLGSEEEQS
jgi:hypothetical protein